MDCVEFIKSINENYGLIINFFDSTFALYNLLGQYTGLSITNESTDTEVRLSVSGEYNYLSYICKEINGMCVTGHVNFNCVAEMVDGNLKILLLPV